MTRGFREKSAQYRAVTKNRRAMRARGVERYEVRGLARDKALIRDLARGYRSHVRAAAKRKGRGLALAQVFAAGWRRLVHEAAIRPGPQNRPWMKYLLDTTILSEGTKPVPSDAVAKWVLDQRDDTLFMASFSLAEIERGVLERAAGRKRNELEAWFRGPQGPKALFAGRILPFDERAAAEWARIMAEGTAAGRPRSATDMIIAATAAANACTVVTLNDRDFRGAVPVINPLARA
jgi:predicted nucleic acid-binding protein